MSERTGWVPSSPTWSNADSAASAIYGGDDPYFIRPEFGDGAAMSTAEGLTALAANELLGIDDFRRAVGLASQGRWGQAVRSGATGIGEIGLTAAAIFGSGPTLGATGLARLAPVIAKGSKAIPGLQNLLRFGYRNPRVAQVARSLAGMFGRNGEGEEAADAAADQAPPSPFVMNLPGAGGGTVASVPGFDMSVFDRYADNSVYETMLDNELAQLSARTGAFTEAVGTEFQRVRSVNEAAAGKALELAASAGEEGFAAWDRAAQGALDVTNTRNAALMQMSGGMPQAIDAGGAVQDFQQLAQTSGTAEQQLQQTLGENRAEDYRWLAEVGDQAAAGWAGEFGRAEQDAAGAAVARHNQAVAARQDTLMQMQFQAALQQQQLATQASLANAQSGAGSTGEILGVAVELANRPGSQGGQILRGLFPDVFPTDADAQGFIDSLGSANPFGT